MQKEHRVIPMTAISTESNSIEASSALHPTDVMQAAMSVADRAPSAAAESDRNVTIVSGHRDHSMIASVTTAIEQIEIKDIKRVRVVMYRRMALDGPMVQAMDDRATDVRPGMTGEIEPMPVDSSGIPNDHMNYAITWFSLAAVWLGMTAYLLWRIRQRTV